jgi:hypothetical protein
MTFPVYHPTSPSATSRSTRRPSNLDNALTAKVLQRACRDVRESPATLPLWAFRLAQWVRRGRLRYRVVWAQLHDAAWEGGATESSITRSLYHGVASANVVDSPPPAFDQLALKGLA